MKNKETLGKMRRHEKLWKLVETASQAVCRGFDSHRPLQGLFSLRRVETLRRSRASRTLPLPRAILRLMCSGARPRMRIEPLDALNFFLADVRGGLGAYVNVLLLT